jgi:hypothetical protein
LTTSSRKEMTMPTGKKPDRRSKARYADRRTNPTGRRNDDSPTPMPTEASKGPMPTEDTAEGEQETPLLHFRIMHRDGSSYRYQIPAEGPKPLHEMMMEGVVIARQAPDPTVGPNRQGRLTLIPTEAIEYVEVV